jgi:hypothetical protein
VKHIAIAALFIAACATPAPEQKPPPKDEFQGFGALRGEPREKKKPAEEDPKGDDGDKGDDKKPKGEKGEKGEKGGDKGGDDAALTKEQVLGAIQTAEKQVNGCLKKFKDPGIYVMEITIAPDGSCSVDPVRAPTRKEQPELWSDVPEGLDGGKSVKSPTNKCLARALGAVKFPAFEGKPVVVTYPLLLK